VTVHAFLDLIALFPGVLLLVLLIIHMIAFGSLDLVLFVVLLVLQVHRALGVLGPELG
jgi:hypothetical protein